MLKPAIRWQHVLVGISVSLSDIVASWRQFNTFTGVCALSLQQHTDEVFVLESNPSDSSILLSASHDGLIIIWDLRSGKAIKSFTNDVRPMFCFT